MRLGTVLLRRRKTNFKFHLPLSRSDHSALLLIRGRPTDRTSSDSKNVQEWRRRPPHSSECCGRLFWTLHYQWNRPVLDSVQFINSNSPFAGIVPSITFSHFHELFIFSEKGRIRFRLIKVPESCRFCFSLAFSFCALSLPPFGLSMSRSGSAKVRRARHAIRGVLNPPDQKIAQRA